MLLGVIADDFTGASDIANTLARGTPPHGGLQTSIFSGVPPADARPETDAAVIALKSRSIPSEQAVAQSVDALDWLLARGCEQVVFKYCSTFDSTPEGNIGPVAEALAQRLEAKGIVACPAFPGARRTVYQGHLFVADRLLNESGMEHHPLNPMTDPDIRRWLARQVSTPVGFVPLEVVRGGVEQVVEALASAALRDEVLVVIDAVSDEDLATIGQAVSRAPLVTGASGIAKALPGNFIARGLAAGGQPSERRVPGPAAVLAGSCSKATRTQVEAYSKAHPSFGIDVDGVMGGTITSDLLATFVLEHAERSPIVYTTSDPRSVDAVKSRHGSERVSSSLEILLAETAKKVLEGGIRLLIVAGGETSGAVVSELDVGPLTVGPELDVGVPLLVSDSSSPIALILKSGNFGAANFFESALAKTLVDL